VHHPFDAEGAVELRAEKLEVEEPVAEEAARALRINTTNWVSEMAKP